MGNYILCFNAFTTVSDKLELVSFLEVYIHLNNLSAANSWFLCVGLNIWEIADILND